MFAEKSKGFSTLLIIVLVSILLIAVFIAWRVYNTEDTQQSNTGDSANTSQQGESEDKAYTNTRYGFSFNYPKNLSVNGVEGVGVEVPASSDSATVRINDDNVFFEMSVQEGQKLEANYIKSQFGATDPSLIELQPTAQGGVEGYEVIFLGDASENIESRFYFVQPQESERVYKITAKKDSESSTKILNSLTINKNEQ